MKQCTQFDNEEGVSHLLEYIIITGILLLLMIIMLLYIYPIFIESPTNQVKYHAYTDIGNGVSTRIVDLYVIAPGTGNITSKFDIPDDVAGQGYYVDITTRSLGSDVLTVAGSNMRIQISLAGIGATIGVGGNTSSSGLNEISYKSSGA